MFGNWFGRYFGNWFGASVEQAQNIYAALLVASLLPLTVHVVAASRANQSAASLPVIAACNDNPSRHCVRIVCPYGLALRNYSITTVNCIDSLAEEGTTP